MAKTNTSWTILDHGPIEQLADNLWRIEGSLPGMSLKRVMTIVRLANGSLLLHSVIALREEFMRQLEALGRPSIMIVPNAYHRLDAPAYKQRYPQLRVYCPSGGRKGVAEVVPVDGVYEDYPADEVARFEPLHGIENKEGALVVRSPDGVTVVLNDTVMNMDRRKDLLGKFFTTLMGSVPGPRVSRFGKLWYVKDQPALKDDLLRLAALPGLVRFMVSHDKVASGNEAAAALRKAATFLR